MEYLYDSGPRRSGRSTRLIDNAIQELFTTGECVLVDHYNTKDMSKYLSNRVIIRLVHEHRLTHEQFRVGKNEIGYYKIELVK